MRGLDAHGVRAGAARVPMLCRRVAEAAADAVPPDVRVAAEEEAVVLTGRNLRARSLADPRLRGIGALVERPR